MIALAVWLGLSLVVACVAGCFIRSGTVDRCNQACNQGRTCTCQTPVETKP